VLHLSVKLSVQKLNVNNKSVGLQAASRANSNTGCLNMNMNEYLFICLLKQQRARQASYGLLKRKANKNYMYTLFTR